MASPEMPHHIPGRLAQPPPPALRLLGLLGSRGALSIPGKVERNMGRGSFRTGRSDAGSGPRRTGPRALGTLCPSSSGARPALRGGMGGSLLPCALRPPPPAWAPLLLSGRVLSGTRSAGTSHPCPSEGAAVDTLRDLWVQSSVVLLSVRTAKLLISPRLTLTVDPIAFKF